MAQDAVKQYPPWFVSMMQDLCDMRDAQRSYFAQRNDHRLKIAKHKESRVDEYVKRFVDAGIICHRQEENINQSKLF